MNKDLTFIVPAAGKSSRFKNKKSKIFYTYKKKSNTNRIRKITTNAPRGLILDRNGEILVDNNPTYVLTAIPGELSQKGEKFGLISNIIGLDSNMVSKNYKKYIK